MESPSPTLTKDNFYPIPPTMIAVPTTLERESQGNNIGNGFLPTHEIDHCHDDLNMSCLELDVDALDTQLVIEDSIDLNVTCVQINEIDSGLSAPSADFNSSIVTGAQIEIFVDESAPTKLIADANEPCDLVVQPDFDHIQLVKSNEVLARILHDNSLFSITMDLPISLSHARDRISEITCLRSFKSVYAPSFQFHLIGDYGVDNMFLVYRICVTCDVLDMLKERKLIRMLDHFLRNNCYSIKPHISYICSDYTDECLLFKAVF
jgi:hypothetical protein